MLQMGQCGRVICYFIPDGSYLRTGDTNCIRSGLPTGFWLFMPVARKMYLCVFYNNDVNKAAGFLSVFKDTLWLQEC